MFVCEITSGGQKKKKKYIYKYLFVFRLAFWCTALSRFLVVAVAVFFFFYRLPRPRLAKEKREDGVARQKCEKAPTKKEQRGGEKKK